jgi:SOS response associated peptidase (SRAP)
MSATCSESSRPAVPIDVGRGGGSPAVEAACQEALGQGVHSADVILNILARRREPAVNAERRLPKTAGRKIPTWFGGQAFEVKAVQRHRCLIPASGFREPEKLAREQGVAPWSYYSMTDSRPFFMAGLWSDAPNVATGEIAETYTLIITDANATMRVHDRMPVILATDAARRWIQPGPLPAELLAPYPAEPMTAWRVSNGAKNSRIEPHAGMAEPVPV